MKNIVITFILSLFFFTTGFTQNQDKASGVLPSQAMDFRAFENSIDAFRGTFVPTDTFVVATISNGASLSDSLDLRDGRVIDIIMPSAWTTANLTFQSWDPYNSVWKDIYENDGTEFTYTASSDEIIIAKPIDFAGFRYLKLRSGTSGTPVNQGADREIVIKIRRY